MEQSVLVVEDDAAVAKFLADNLSADGFSVWVADETDAALKAIELREPDLVLLDLWLRGSSGLGVLDAVRSSDGVSSRFDPELPVMVVSALGSELDRVRGLDRGADDYVVKPFSYPELLGRVRAVLRRASARRLRGVLRVGELEVDPVSRRVTLGGVRVEVTAKELSLLQTLASDPTRVWTKRELLRDVWGYQGTGVTRTIDVHAFRLRKKLSSPDRELVLNVRGVGYRLMEGPA
jgi:DNA-binding response OmpR family regulator